MKSTFVVAHLFFYLEERKTKIVPSWKIMVLQKILILKEKEKEKEKYGLIAQVRIDHVLIMHKQ